MLDLRYPMGMMFALVGAMLTVYGVYTNSAGMKPGGIYQLHSLGINVNFVWGLALLGFGLIMLALARWSAAAEKGRKERDDMRAKAESRTRLG